MDVWTLPRTLCLSPGLVTKLVVIPDIGNNYPLTSLLNTPPPTVWPGWATSRPPACGSRSARHVSSSASARPRSAPSSCCCSGWRCQRWGRKCPPGQHACKRSYCVFSQWCHLKNNVCQFRIILRIIHLFLLIIIAKSRIICQLS